MCVLGAAGQEALYLGYVELGISFPRTEAGIDRVFQTLVVVVPEKQYKVHVPLILGTNLAKQCRNVCQEEGGFKGWLFQECGNECMVRLDLRKIFMPGVPAVL